MIRGTVNGRLEPIVPLRLCDSVGQFHEVAALIDTGFTHFLTLPPDVIALLGLSPQGQDLFVTSDGRVAAVETFLVAMEWDNQQVTVTAIQIEGTPLLGARLLLGHQLRVNVWDGGTVEIEKRP